MVYMVSTCKVMHPTCCDNQTHQWCHDSDKMTNKSELQNIWSFFQWSWSTLASVLLKHFVKWKLCLHQVLRGDYQGHFDYWDSIAIVYCDSIDNKYCDTIVIATLLHSNWKHWHCRNAHPSNSIRGGLIKSLTSILNMDIRPRRQINLESKDVGEVVLAFMNVKLFLDLRIINITDRRKQERYFLFKEKATENH